MPYVDELKPEKNLFALFVSRSGQGKTTAAASFPKPTVMDFDGRIRGLIQTQHLLTDRIYFEQFLLPKAGWDVIYKFLDEVRNNCIFNIKTVETLVPDSLTALTRLFLFEGSELMQGGRKVSKTPKDSNTGLRVFGPSDYNYESAATNQAFMIMRSLQQWINVICTAHIIPRYGKPPIKDSYGNETDKDNVYADSIEIGEKLALRDKIEAEILIYFNEVYQFEKENNKFYVNFDSDLARSSLGLKGRHDITNKNFYSFWKEQVEIANTNRKPPTKSESTGTTAKSKVG